MKKPVKKILKFLLWTVIVIVALVLTLPLWIGVVKPIAGIVVPQKTGTPFHMGELALNQYTGHFATGDIQLQNPAGFKQKMAATLGKLSVDVEVGSLFTDTIVVKEVLLTDVFVSYVSNDAGENNFAVIARNANGGKAETKPQAEQQSAAPAKQAEKQGGDQPAKKVIIDHLLIDKVVVQLGPVTLPLPKIELNGIGRKSKGVTIGELYDEISASIVKALTAAGANINELAGALGKMGVENANKLLDSAKSGTAIIQGAAGKTVDSVGKTATSTVDAVGKTTTKTVDAVGKTTTKTINAVGETTGKAVDATKESATKAVNAIKGLFN